MKSDPAGKPVRPTPKAEETRRRILAAALDLFQEHGFAETTMRDIARRADVATGAAYYYFPSKEAIVMAFYWETHTDFDATCQESLRGIRDLRGRIRALIGLKLEQFRPYREFLGALF
ncbi:MAG TPA: helix-turn-helix domain-containing protein, partial [Thermoanaerobaculia bacterium]|nr:helix-turn-helix domain-containing protein [Thermoanaerobaculia bacterium]